MKNLSKLEDFADMITYLTQIESQSSHIVIWQLDEVTNTRNIHSGKLVEVGENDSLDFTQIDDQAFNFDEGHVFFYIESKQLLFKARQHRNDDSYLSVAFPDEIKILDRKEQDAIEHSICMINEKLRPHFPEFEVNKKTGYEFEVNTNKAQKGDDYFELESEREKIKTEYDVIETEREKIQTVYDVLESEREKIDDKEISGYVSGGTDQVGGMMGGKSYSGTDHVSSTMSAGYSGTDKVVTKESTKSLEQSDRDKAIFEEELSFVSLDEEDKFFAAKRDAPRAKPKAGKSVIMKKQTDPEDFEGITNPLFDLSRGGLGAITQTEELYEKGEVLLILGFDNNRLDAPMLAIVRSIRETDEGDFKVGMQFYNEGMD